MNMDHASATGSGDWPDCQPPSPDGCDPSPAIDERKCRDKGLAAQLDYSTSHAEALDQARDNYELARADYREQRHAAALKVSDMEHQVRHLIERIRCLIEQDRVVRCLDDAYCEVSKMMDCCEGTPGCCAEVVEFDPVPPKRYRKLVHRIERYQAEVDKAKACFVGLVEEPGQLTARVDGVKADLDSVVAALADDASKVDLKKQYATALVVRRRLELIWNGFSDNAAYVDCLCQAITTWSAGVEAVALLTGAKAVLDCKGEAASAWCAKLTATPVLEILAIYDTLCSSDKPCGHEVPDEPDSPDESETPPGGGPHEDCGCGRHHDDKDSTRGMGQSS